MKYVLVTSFVGDLGACPITPSQASELRDQQRQKTKAKETKLQAAKDNSQIPLPLQKVSIPQHVNGMARWAKGSLDQ
jgi:hypothetical protein